MNPELKTYATEAGFVCMDRLETNRAKDMIFPPESSFINAECSTELERFGKMVASKCAEIAGTAAKFDQGGAAENVIREVFGIK